MEYSFKEIRSLVKKLSKNASVNPDDFHTPQTGKVIRTPKGYYALIPPIYRPPIIFTIHMPWRQAQEEERVQQPAQPGSQPE